MGRPVPCPTTRGAWRPARSRAAGPRTPSARLPLLAAAPSEHRMPVTVERVDRDANGHPDDEPDPRQRSQIQHQPQTGQDRQDRQRRARRTPGSRRLRSGRARRRMITRPTPAMGRTALPTLTISSSLDASGTRWPPPAISRPTTRCDLHRRVALVGHRQTARQQSVARHREHHRDKPSTRDQTTVVGTAEAPIEMILAAQIHCR